MDLLWPDQPPARSAPRLHKAAHFARRAAGRPDAIVLRDDVVWLFPDSEVTVDAIRFEQLARVAVAERDPDAAREALAWYRGELLPGDRYEDWAADRRELLHLRRLDVLRLAGEWRELAELDPTDEEAHVELMRRHLAAGDAAAAIRQYEHLERTLERQLAATPGARRPPSPARRRPTGRSTTRRRVVHLRRCAARRARRPHEPPERGGRRTRSGRRRRTTGDYPAEISGNDPTT